MNKFWNMESMHVEKKFEICMNENVITLEEKIEKEGFDKFDTT